MKEPLFDYVKESLKIHKPTNESQFFPLVFNNFGEEEIYAAIEVLLSGKLTMGEKVNEFERQFANYLGVPYAVMVNSGSSANLLAFAAITNKLRNKHLNIGDEVLIPAVCWSTSFSPIIQCGLVPKLVDIDSNSLNISIQELKKSINSKTKAIMNVHILGNSTNMDELTKICEENDLILIEDTCEALGSSYKNLKLGSFGDFGTFSFYFSHHITTIEGGMIVCKSLEDYDLLKTLRAHGWSRLLSDQKTWEEKFPEIDPRFLFVNVGYNFRPMEIQAAFGIEQLKKINNMNIQRKKNVEQLKNSLVNHKLWDNQFSFPITTKNTDAIWFGFIILLNEKYKNHKEKFQKYLLQNGIDSRPIISGNFALQPVYKFYCNDNEKQELFNAQKINDLGIFMGCHTTPINKNIENKFTEIILNFFKNL